MRVLVNDQDRVTCRIFQSFFHQSTNSFHCFLNVSLQPTSINSVISDEKFSVIYKLYIDRHWMITLIIASLYVAIIDGKSVSGSIDFSF